MATRYEYREIIVQTLFECDFSNSLDRNNVLTILERNNKEFIEKDNDAKFAIETISGILDKKEILDEVILKAAPEWPIDKISKVDLVILRIAVYEVVFGTSTPEKVAIDEAVELAKEFGSDTSSKFVNGVLGAVVEMKEKEKNDKQQ
jgi:N utilization substance protein B